IFILTNDTPAQLNASEEYARRLRLRNEQLSAIRHRHERLWMGVILAAAAGGVAVWASLLLHLLSPLMILLPVLAIPIIFRSMAEITPRQEAVRELCGGLEFQETWMAVGGASPGSGDTDTDTDPETDDDPQTLRAWAQSPPAEFPTISRILAFALPIGLIATL